MNRESAIRIAKYHAALSDLPYTQVENFEPHKWVLDAIAEAYQDGELDGRDDGYDAGYEDGIEEGRSD